MPGNLPKQPIDEIVLKILNLEDVFDLDYETYFTLLKEVLVEITAEKRTIPSEEVEILKEALKEAKSKKNEGRFQPVKKGKKITSNNVSGIKMLPGSGGALVKYDKNLNNKIAKNDYFDRIISSLDNIIQILTDSYKFEQNINEKRRRKGESEKREKRESALEKLKKGFSLIVNTAKKLLSPLNEIFERIIRFITFVILGRAFVALMKWLGDPKNKSKIETLGKLLKTFWPAILAALVLFTTPFGKFVRVVIGMISRFSIKMLKLIPRLLKIAKGGGASALRFAAANPLLTAGAITGLSASAGYLMEKGEKERVAKEQGTQIPKRGQEKGFFNTLGEGFASAGQLGSSGITGFNLGGLIKSGHGYNGIDSNTGERISGAGPDTQLIAARPGEVVLTPEDQDYVYQRTGFDVANYVADRKPKFIKSSNIKFGGQGYADGGVIQRFNQGGIVGGIQSLWNRVTGNSKKPKQIGPEFTPQISNRLLRQQPGSLTKSAKQMIDTRWSASSVGVNPSVGCAAAIKNVYSKSGIGLPWKNVNPNYVPDIHSFLNKNFLKVSEGERKPGDIVIWKDTGYPPGSGKEPYGHIGIVMPDGRIANNSTSKGTFTNLNSPQDAKSWWPNTKELIYFRDPKVNQALINPPPANNKNIKKSNQNIFTSLLSNLAPRIQSLGKIRSPRNFGGLNKLKGYAGGGLIKESTGFNIPGATRDRQLLPPTAVEPGESHYVFSKLATQNGAVEIAKVIESHLNPNSSAAKLGYQSKKIPIITPLPGAMSNSGNMVSTLPPITKAVGGNGGAQGFIEDNTGVFFSPVSPSSLTTRKMYHDLLGVVSAG